jgi:hypothetical protein
MNPWLTVCVCVYGRFYFRMPRASDTRTDDWDTLVPSFDNSWMTLAQAMMDVYVKRTHGTYIEQKGEPMGEEGGRDHIGGPSGDVGEVEVGEGRG